MNRMLLLMVACVPAYAEVVPLPNPGFESGTKEWKLFIPPEFSEKSAAFTIDTETAHSGSASARMETQDYFRYLISPLRAVAAIPGERFRISAWVKLGTNAVIKPGAMGVYLRVNFMNANSKIALNESGFVENICIGLGGNQAVESKAKLVKMKTPPTDWTQISGVIEVPPGNIQRMNLCLTVQEITGSVHYDDVEIEKVSEETPLSPSNP